MGLFTKKPGGTFLGNLLRTTSSIASGGVLGSGRNMLPKGAVIQRKDDPVGMIGYGGQGTYDNPRGLPEIVVTSDPYRNNAERGIGSAIERITRSSREVSVKGDNDQILILGGLALAGFFLFKKL